MFSSVVFEETACPISRHSIGHDNLEALLRLFQESRKQAPDRRPLVEAWDDNRDVHLLVRVGAQTLTALENDGCRSSWLTLGAWRREPLEDEEEHEADDHDDRQEEVA